MGGGPARGTLDILTQRAIIDVLKEMQTRLGFSIVFISHDLALAAEMADRVATMYAGEIVEQGTVDEIFYAPLHPYTLGLLRSVPRLSGGREELKSIRGNPPNLIQPPPGCKFHPRCPFATEKCQQDAPHWPNTHPVTSPPAGTPTGSSRLEPTCGRKRCERSRSRLGPGQAFV